MTSLHLHTYSNRSNWLFLTFCLLLGVILNVNGQTIVKGKLDLSKTNAQSDKVIKLSGEWQFECGKHLTYREMTNINEHEKTYLKIPSSWTQISKNSKKLSAYGIGTYYLQIILDNKGKNSIKEYGFSIGNIITAYKLWVNGNLIGQAGIASVDSTKFKPIYLPQSCYLNTKSDTLNVIIQVSNYYDPIYSGLWQNIYFGNKENIEHFDWKIILFTLFIFSAFVLIFFYQISISFVQKNEKSHLVIALLALNSMIKMLLDGPVSIYNFIPNIDFTIYYRFWLFSFFIIYLILKLTKITYPKEINKSAVRYFDWFYGISAFAFLVLDIHTILSHIILIVYANLICLIYLFSVIITAVIRGRDYSILTLIGFSIMVMFVLNDLIFVVTQSSYGYLSHIGVIIHIIIQSITVSLKFALSHDKVINLSEELIDTNNNLEVQVSIRTEELNKVNEKLAVINKQKDFLISTISHDLMGTFNILIAFSKNLYNDKTLIDEQHKTIARIYQISNKGYYMLDNILAWAKLNITYKQDIKTITNLNELINENIYLLADQINSKSLITYVDINNNYYFNSSYDHLHTIIRNLLSNAIKYSNIGGQIQFTNKASGNFVQIEIIDNGIGMSPQILTSVFDPEKNKKREGTSGERGSGLGLFIVKELVESNSGKISCKSETDYGTQFIIEFPLHNIN